MKTELFESTENIEELEAVAERAFGATPDSALSEWFSFDEMKKAVGAQRGACIKAIDDNGKLLGFIYAQQENPINGKEGLDKWVIVIAAVEPDVSGKGVGSLLLKAIEAEAAKSGASKMFVYTNKGDDEVVHFYEKNGYVDAGWIKDYQYGKDNSAVFLLKYLND